jgi:hypothetical protein
MYSHMLVSVNECSSQGHDKFASRQMSVSRAQTPGYLGLIYASSSLLYMLRAQTAVRGWYKNWRRLMQSPGSVSCVAWKGSKGNKLAY